MRADAEDWFTGSPDAEGNPNAPFDKPFYIMLNLAVGGKMSADYNEKGIHEDTYPAEVQADWFRIYQCSTDTETGRACMDDSPL